MTGIFGNRSPAGSAKRGSGAKPSVGENSSAASELSKVDFSNADLSIGLEDCAGLVEVQEVGAGIGAIYEEAAVLYANGSVREAEKLLEAVLAEESAAAGEGLWMMLLDLYQLTGQRERFESRVLDYATRFERSPPPYVDLSSGLQRRKSDLAALVNLNGNLTSQAEPQFKQMFVIGQKSGALRVDLKRVRSIDEDGCRLILDLVAGLARERARLFLLNGEGLLTQLEGQLQVGVAECQPAWLLLLELLQHGGAHDRFEQWALDYAITFEESPPSWESKPRPPAAVASSSANTSDSADKVVDDTVLEGELTSSNNESVRRLAALGTTRQLIELDCSQLRRMDFVSAGMLFNVLSALQGQGTRVKLLNVNAMVGALLRVMGVDQVAQVNLRR